MSTANLQGNLSCAVDEFFLGHAPFEAEEMVGTGEVLWLRVASAVPPGVNPASP